MRDFAVFMCCFFLDLLRRPTRDDFFLSIEQLVCLFSEVAFLYFEGLIGK